jgi:hypothetical protein
LGDIFNILRCVGVIRVVEVIEVRVRVIEVRIIVSVRVIALFEDCVLRGIVWGALFLI